MGLSHPVSSHWDHGLHVLVLRRFIGALTRDFKLWWQEQKGAYPGMIDGHIWYTSHICSNKVAEGHY